MPDNRLSISYTHRAALIGCLSGLAIIAVAPLFLDVYLTNILIRTLFVAAVVMTVDILWGYTGVLTFGQSAFFGIGAYACGLVFTHYGFGPGWALAALAVALGTAAIVAVAVGWLAFFHGSSPLYSSIITLALPIVLTQIGATLFVLTYSYEDPAKIATHQKPAGRSREHQKAPCNPEPNFQVPVICWES